MKIRFILSLAILVFSGLIIGPRVYADDINDCNQLIQDVQAHRDQVVAQLNLTPFADRPIEDYGEKEDHYGQEYIMSDFIDKGIR